MLEIDDIAAALREQRKRLGLNQHELAEKAGVSRILIAKFETGRYREIGIGKLVRMLNAVGLDLRLTALNHQRPTLEDLMAENERENG